MGINSHFSETRTTSRQMHRDTRRRCGSRNQVMVMALVFLSRASSGKKIATCVLMGWCQVEAIKMLCLQHQHTSQATPTTRTHFGCRMLEEAPIIFMWHKDYNTQNFQLRTSPVHMIGRISSLKITHTENMIKLSSLNWRTTIKTTANSLTTLTEIQLPSI